MSIPEHVRRRLSVSADVHPRTLDRYLDGYRCYGRGRERIENALAVENWRKADDGRWYKTIAATLPEALAPVTLAR